jgi:adenosylcobinamide-GDP ribazoletransferase
MNSFWVGLQFLTRIRVWRQVNWTSETCGGSVKFFPLYGAVIGGVLAAGYYVCGQFFPPLLTAVLLLILEVYITGGIHVDGFMDTMDGLFSGRSPERILEIMKDSRVGAHGVIAFGLLYLSKFSIYYEFPSEILMPALIITPVLGRWTMVMGITQFPYARPEGMGKCFHQFAGRSAMPVATVFAAAAAAALGWMGAVVFTVVGAWAYLFCRRVSQELGGLTGDVYGAVTELTQVVAMVVIYLSVTWIW